jgi:hypothetical protein
MACKSCNLDDFCFDPKLLLADTNGLCSDCKYISKLINEFAESSLQQYVMDLDLYLHSIGPVKKGEGIAFINYEVINDSRINPDSLIAEIIKRFGLENTTYVGNLEIKTICNQLIGLLIDDFTYIFVTNPRGYFISLLTVLEYNTFITLMTMTWLYNKNDLTTEGIITEDRFLKTIIDTFEMIKLNDRMFKQIYPMWQSQIAEDKIALQIGIEIINNYINKENENNNLFSTDKTLQLINTLRAISKVIIVRDMALNKLLVTNSIRINQDGIIDVVDKMNTIEQYNKIFLSSIDYFSNSNKENLYEKYLLEFDKLTKAHLGFPLSYLHKLSSELLLQYKDSDCFLIGDKEYYFKLLEYLLKCKRNESISILNLLINEPVSIFNYISCERGTRPLRRSLFKVHKDKYICQLSLLGYSVTGLYLDILEGKVDNKPLKSNLSKVYKKIATEFELSIYNLLRDNLSHYVKHNIEQKQIPNLITNGFVSLNGEIDILMLYKQRLFIIDCKNMSFKFMINSIRNEVNKLKKISSKDTFANKMNTNINIIYENWESVIQFLGVDPLTISRKQPVGIFVTNGFSITTSIDGLPYPVIDSLKIIDWISEQKW